MFVIIFQGNICDGKSNLCFDARTSGILDASFPYLMLAGGLILGYGMKSLADSRQEEPSPVEGSDE